MRDGPVANAPTYKAQDVHDYVSGVFASADWPQSRDALNGLWLRQVSDAIKMHVAQLYIRGRESGAGGMEAYDHPRRSWPSLMVSLPIAFLRPEDWPRIATISDVTQRRLAATVAWDDEDARNEEEKEFWQDESFESFSAYPETLPCDYPGIFAHVLGHLSTRYIYTSDMIPAARAGHPSK